MVPKILRYVAFGLALLYGVLGAVFVIGGSTAAVVLPVLALGGLFLLAGALEHRTTGPHGGVRARPSAR